MLQNERRKPQVSPDQARLEAGLTPGQLATLDTMRQFNWQLRFVRRPLFQAPIPVLFERNGGRFVVLEPDGSIDENPSLKLRG
ncbi:MAG: hypothetical protein J7507_03780 [Pseudoxanthomonas sp.]|nr:hypothetical protein [Pseudoxanthomonas sp.]